MNHCNNSKMSNNNKRNNTYYLDIFLLVSTNREHTVGIVQFDTTKNRFLAAGDESTIKIWDMDNINPLTTIHADGGLPVILSNDRGLYLFLLLPY